MWSHESIASASLSVYQRLSKKGKPSLDEWTPLATFSITDERKPGYSLFAHTLHTVCPCNIIMFMFMQSSSFLFFLSLFILCLCLDVRTSSWHPFRTIFISF